MYHSCVESSPLLCPEPEERFTSSELQQKHPTLPSTDGFKTTSSQTAQARLQRRHTHTPSLGTHSSAKTRSFKYCTYDPRVEERNTCFLIEFESVFLFSAAKKASDRRGFLIMGPRGITYRFLRLNITAACTPWLSPVLPSGS